MRDKWYRKRITKLFLLLQCSVTCGNGARTRAVECTGGKGNCNARTQPHSTARCYLGSCPEWNVGRWSQVINIFFLFFTKNTGLQPATLDLRIKAKSCAFLASYIFTPKNARAVKTGVN